MIVSRRSRYWQNPSPAVAAEPAQVAVDRLADARSARVDRSVALRAIVLEIERTALPPPNLLRQTASISSSRSGSHVKDG